MTRRAVCIALGAALIVATAGITNAAAGDPRASYDRIILADHGPVEPDLQAFIERARDVMWHGGANVAAGNATATGFGDVLADEVTLFVGPPDLVEDDRFVPVARLPRAEAMKAIGRAVYDEPATDRGAEMHAGYVLKALLEDGLVAPNSSLGGEVCTGTFEKLAYADMTALLEDTGTVVSDWGVARRTPAETRFFRGGALRGWELGQLLYVDADAPQIRSCCWGYLVMPEGVGDFVQMGFGGGPLIPYLASHVCFAKTDQGWRISAVAIRKEQ